MNNQAVWTPIDGLTLEPNASKAVTALKNMVVSAGPGAGKTELLAQRADFLFRTGHCRYPQRILAISFKTDSARNLSKRVRKRSGDQYAERFDSMTFDAFAKMIVDNYRVALSDEYQLNEDYEIDTDVKDDDFQHDRTNFHQLIKRACQILDQNPYALYGLRQTYSYVFMDEFQDTTKLQYDMVKRIFQDSSSIVTAVGDTKQTIMEWAGALPGIMEKYKTDFDANVVQLYQNFRSLPRLRRAQRNVISTLNPTIASSAEAISGDGGVIQICPYTSDIEEAEDLTNKIQRWLENGTNPNEIAVLVRQQPNYVAQPIMHALQEKGIAYCNEDKLQDLLVEPAVAVIFNFLRVVIKGADPEAYIALKQFAELVSVTELAAQRLDRQLTELISQATQKVHSSGFKNSDHDAWKTLLNGLWKIFPDALFRSLSRSYHQGTRLQEVKQQAYQAFFDELRVDDGPNQALRRLSGEDAIRILTIHKSKGLEFEKVIVLGVEEQLFWSKSRDYVDNTSIPRELLHVFFVAISRAKHELVLTSASTRRTPEGFSGRRWDINRQEHKGLIRLVRDI